MLKTSRNDDMFHTLQTFLIHYGTSLKQISKGQTVNVKLTNT